MTPARWYVLGRFRILALPLPTNPAFTTHRIYLGQLFLGAQLSVPCESDCEWHEKDAAGKACAPGEITGKPYGFTIVHKRRGRPRKADSERELAEAMDA